MHGTASGMAGIQHLVMVMKMACLFQCGLQQLARHGACDCETVEDSLSAVVLPLTVLLGAASGCELSGETLCC